MTPVASATVARPLANYWVGLTVESVTPTHWETRKGPLDGWTFRFRATNGEIVQGLTDNDPHGKLALYAHALCGDPEHIAALVGRKLIGYLVVNPKGWYQITSVRRFPNDWDF